jgi:hypothetical protein
MPDCIPSRLRIIENQLKTIRKLEDELNSSSRLYETTKVCSCNGDQLYCYNFGIANHDKFGQPAPSEGEREPQEPGGADEGAHCEHGAGFISN